MTTNTDFWNDRAQSFGHTGWANNVVYAYDQSARLNAIEQIVRKYAKRRGLAVDFGAGSGDFSAMLANVFDRVIATDISSSVIEVARRRHASKERIDFRVCATVDEIELPAAGVDLALSITVLGHLMSDDDLCAAIDGFRRALHPEGLFVALEYTPTQQRPQSKYQRFLSAPQWIERFEDQGFRLIQAHGFYHPTEQPSTGYLQYSQSLTVRLANRLGTALIGACRRKARAIQARESGDYWPAENEDTMRIMVFSPVAT